MTIQSGSNAAYLKENSITCEMELFARFSHTYPAGNQDIKNDDEINDILNKKLIDFLKKNSVKEYRILNGQTTFLPKPAFGPGNESVLCSIHIAYKL